MEEVAVQPQIETLEGALTIAVHTSGSYQATIRHEINNAVTCFEEVLKELRNHPDPAQTEYPFLRLFHGVQKFRDMMVLYAALLKDHSTTPSEIPLFVNDIQAYHSLVDNAQWLHLETGIYGTQTRNEALIASAIVRQLIPATNGLLRIPVQFFSELKSGELTLPQTEQDLRTYFVQGYGATIHQFIKFEDCTAVQSLDDKLTPAAAALVHRIASIGRALPTLAYKPNPIQLMKDYPLLSLESINAQEQPISKN